MAATLEKWPDKCTGSGKGPNTHQKPNWHKLDLIIAQTSDLKIESNMTLHLDFEQTTT